MPVNDTTTNRGYQKPNIANTLADDVGRLRSALDSIDTDMVSKAPTAGPTFTGVTTVAAGSAGAPSLTFTGATSDTGIYSPGSDQVAISTGGTGRLFVDASGQLGLGTSAPSAQLHLSATSGSVTARVQSGTGFVDLAQNGSDSYLTNGSGATGTIQFWLNSSERGRWDSSGRLLVGTSSDSGGALLQINGDRFRVGTAKTPASATATGTTGEICWDASYVYVCIATDTWKRAALSTW